MANQHFKVYEDINTRYIVLLSNVTERQEWIMYLYFLNRSFLALEDQHTIISNHYNLLLLLFIIIIRHT